MRAKPARRFQLTGSSTHSAVMVRSRRSVLLKLLVRRNVRRADNARVEVDVPHDGPMVLRNLADRASGSKPRAVRWADTSGKNARHKGGGERFYDSKKAEYGRLGAGTGGVASADATTVTLTDRP